MKIKQVCDRTGLTERTIRFYIEKQLLKPNSQEQSNGRTYLTFDETDIDRLNEIAVLRRLDFGLDEIRIMYDSPGKISSFIDEQLASQRYLAQQRHETVELLSVLSTRTVNSVSELAGHLADISRSRSLPQIDLEPDFGRFDPETNEEKAKARVRVEKWQTRQEKKERLLKPVQISIGIIAVFSLLFLLGLWLSAIPTNVSWTSQGVMLRTGTPESEGELMTVRVEGKLSHRWFSNPEFEGRLILGDFAYTKSWDLTGINFQVSEDNLYRAPLTWSTITDGKPELETLGMVWTDKKMSHMAIMVFEPLNADSKSSTDLFLAAPSDDKADALALIKELIPAEHLPE